MKKPVILGMISSLVLQSVMSVSLAAGNITPVRKPLQFVLLAFDGSEVRARWEDTRAFAKANNVKFTYFVSGVLWLGRMHRSGSTAESDMIMAYQGPGHNPGASDIGFSEFRPENTATNQPAITERIEEMNMAMAEGHELGSHANGHFEGSGWTGAQWDQEFDDFNRLLFENPYKGSLKNANVSRPFLTGMNYKKPQFVGFRTPYLSQNAALYPVLKKYGFTYDTSKTAEPSYWPEKINGVWNFPLAELTLDNCDSANEQCRTLSMDYNFYVSQAEPANRNAPVDVTDPQKLKFLHDQMLNTYRGYFKENYHGNRAPISIGHHFAQWNNGIYWDAMKEFAKEVCNLQDVRCITYTDLVKFMESLTPNELQAYRQGVYTNEPAVLAGVPHILDPKPAEKRSVAQASTQPNDEIDLARMLMKSANRVEKRAYQNFINRWSRFKLSAEQTATRIRREDLPDDHWLKKTEARAAKRAQALAANPNMLREDLKAIDAHIRNEFHDRSYEELKKLGLAHIPSKAHLCEGSSGNGDDGDCKK